VDGVSLEVAAGGFFCLLGPSGSGKSTLLRVIGGYLRPDEGRVWLHGKDLTGAPPEKRNTGMVFQNYALFPHLNALDNVAFGLRVKRMGKAERHAKAHEMLDWVGLTADERLRRPSQLSGGQQQRVALARALAFGPGLLMLDEPFANLDRSLRERLRAETRAIQQRAGITTILVTHDRDEAFALGDRVGVMHQGRLLQTGTPEELYCRPVSAEVAQFLGHRNVLTAEQSRLLGTALKVSGPVMLFPEKLRLQPLTTDGGAAAGAAVIAEHDGAAGTLPAMVQRVVFAGGRREIAVSVEGGLELEVHTLDDAVPAAGSAVKLVIPLAAVVSLGADHVA
jgi:ABC-type Fe3+/spermidine/putrescine transport system ATPase subunit